MPSPLLMKHTEWGPGKNAIQRYLENPEEQEVFDQLEQAKKKCR